MQRYLNSFERFRSGGGFLVTLSVFLVLWLVSNFRFWFDPDNLTLNLILSIEAAYAMPVLLMASSKRAAAESERLSAVLSATHELLTVLRSMAAEQKEIAEDVEEIREDVDRD